MVTLENRRPRLLEQKHEGQTGRRTSLFEAVCIVHRALHEVAITYLDTLSHYVTVCTPFTPFGQTWYPLWSDRTVRFGPGG